MEVAWGLLEGKRAYCAHVYASGFAVVMPSSLMCEVAQALLSRVYVLFPPPPPVFTFAERLNAQSASSGAQVDVRGRKWRLLAARHRDARPPPPRARRADAPPIACRMVPMFLPPALRCTSHVLRATGGGLGRRVPHRSVSCRSSRARGVRLRPHRSAIHKAPRDAGMPRRGVCIRARAAVESRALHVG